MKISCEAIELKKALNIALKAITGKTSTPIMSGVYLLAQGEKLILRGSDLNISIETNIPVTVETPGAVLVNGKFFTELIGKIEGTIDIFDEGQELLVKSSGNNIYHIVKMNDNDYPEFPQLNVQNTLSLDAKVFSDMVYMTEFSCATEDARPLFTGILMEIKEGKLTFVGTNTHRLSIKSVDMEGDDLTCVIPSRVLNEIRNIVQTVPEAVPVEIGLLYNQVMLSVGETKLITRLLDGRFPDYRRVIPQTFNVQAAVDRADLMKILDRVVIFSKQNDHSTVKLNFAEGKLQVNASGIDIGNASEEVDCEMQGEALKIAFNAGYIMDILRHTEAEKITFKLNTSLTPGLLDVNDPNFIYIITPVRVL